MRLPVLLLMTTVLAFAGTGWAQESNSEAKAAFEQLKQLQGDWQAKDTKGKTERVTYRLVSNGSAVQETYTGSEGEMLTVYTLDGNRVLLTHYCIAHNQPRMEAKGLHDGVLDFRFLDATGLASADAGHMHDVSFHFVDADHLQETWRFVENGKEKMTENMELARLR